MQTIEELKSILLNMEKNVTDLDSKKKIEYLKVLLNNDGAFFDIDMKTAYGILDFLQIPKENQKAYYLNLTSPDMYVNGKREYVSIEK